MILRDSVPEKLHCIFIEKDFAGGQDVFQKEWHAISQPVFNFSEYEK